MKDRDDLSPQVTLIASMSLDELAIVCAKITHTHWEYAGPCKSGHAIIVARGAGKRGQNCTVAKLPVKSAISEDLEANGRFIVAARYWLPILVEKARMAEAAASAAGRVGQQ